MKPRNFQHGERPKRLLLAFLSFALVAAAPEATPEQLYREGVAARHAGQHERAAELLRQLIAAEPANADAHLQLGLALMAAGRLDEAEASLRHTLELAPNYEDARAGLARLARLRSDSATPVSTDATGLSSQMPSAVAPAYRWQVNLDGSYSSLSGQADWREGGVQIRNQVDERTALTGTLELADRFGRSDLYGDIRLDHRLSDGASVYVSAGGTPNADFRPEWQVGAGGSARVRSGPHASVLTLDARQARYLAGDIQTVSPGIEQYLAGGKAWLTARSINIFDEGGRHQGGWLVRGDVLTGSRTRLFAGLADAPDVSEGVVTDTFSTFGGLAVDVTERTSLRLSLAHEDRARGSDRTQVAIGYGFRF